MTPEMNNAFEAFCASYNSGSECFECVQPLCKAAFLAGAAHEREECARELEGGRMFALLAQISDRNVVAETFAEAAKHIRARGNA